MSAERIPGFARRALAGFGPSVSLPARIGAAAVTASAGKNDSRRRLVRSADLTLLDPTREVGRRTVVDAPAPNGFGRDPDPELSFMVFDLCRSADFHAAGGPWVDRLQIIDHQRRSWIGLQMTVSDGLGQIESAGDDLITVDGETDGRHIGLAADGSSGKACNALALEVGQFGVGEHGHENSLVVDAVANPASRTVIPRQASREQSLPAVGSRRMVQSMERFSERAHRVVEVAEEEARQLDHPYFGTEHLLLGLIVVEGPAHDALVSAGATADATRAKVAEAVGQRGSGQLADLQLSARARRAIDRASRLSLQRRDPQVDPEHLLVGVLDVEGRAGQALRRLGVDVAALRLAVDLPREYLPGDHEPTATAGRSAAPPPHCVECGSGLGEPRLRYRIIAAQDEHGRVRDFAVTWCAVCGAVVGTSPV
jgi:hypothetical protein